MFIFLLFFIIIFNDNVYINVHSTAITDPIVPFNVIVFNNIMHAKITTALLMDVLGPFEVFRII